VIEGERPSANDAVRSSLGSGPGTEPEMPLSTKTTFPQQPKVTEQARRELRPAWIFLAILPISFGAAMVLGDWLLSVQGYERGDGEVPVSVVLSAGVPAMLVMVAPTLGAGWFLEGKAAGSSELAGPVRHSGCDRSWVDRSEPSPVRGGLSAGQVTNFCHRQASAEKAS